MKKNINEQGSGTEGWDDSWSTGGNTDSGWGDSWSTGGKTDNGWGDSWNNDNKKKKTPSSDLTWDNYPCVVELAKQKGVSADKNNAYLIGDFRYFSNGRKHNYKTKAKGNFTCNDLEFKKSNDNVDTSSSDEHIELNGIYRTKGDPYQYKIIDCVWYTKGKSITNWKSLEDNQTANDLLDARFPNARKNCKNNKPEEVLKPIIPNFDDEFEDVDDAEEANDIINN
jgi:hypothetical protein